MKMTVDQRGVFDCCVCQQPLVGLSVLFSPAEECEGVRKSFCLACFELATAILNPAVAALLRPFFTREPTVTEKIATGIRSFFFKE